MLLKATNKVEMSKFAAKYTAWGTVQKDNLTSNELVMLLEKVKEQKDIVAAFNEATGLQGLGEYAPSVYRLFILVKEYEHYGKVSEDAKKVVIAESPAAWEAFAAVYKL